MKKIILVPIIIGSVVVVAGAVLLGVGIANANKSLTRETKTYDNLEAFNNLNIKLSIADLEFYKAEDGKTKILADETSVDKYEIGVSNSTLNIRFIDNREWYQRAFTWYTESLKVKIYLPEENYGDLTIDTATGDTKLPSNFTFENLNYEASTGNLLLESKITNYAKIKSSTGNNTIKGISPNNLYIKDSTGNINLEDVTTSEDITTDVSTGKANMKNVTAKTLNIKASTGDVNLNNVVIQEDVNIKTSTGDVKFSDFDGALVEGKKISIKTDTGDVKGVFLTSKIFDVRADTGHPSYPQSTKGSLCEIETDTGKIVVTIKG